MAGVSPPRLIGLMGYAGAGKSEVAKRLRDRHGFLSPHIIRPVKAMMEGLLQEIGYDAETIARYVDGDLKRAVIPELGVTSTFAQQTLGTEWGRNCIRPDLWLSLWLRKIEAALLSGARIVQESVRFKEEAEAIRARGGVLIEIRRPGVGPQSDHASEILPGVPDLVIENEASIAALQVQVDRLMSSVDLS
ncbi:hypothetical protein [Microvirga solisilvae]|uniref:deoxynucleotide monophosphate kinase family protein n=1 Tax=Microvirga solisilvae TaxID=2919498 RepID=UPI001FAFB417|nr:hypothetical protein [Microvirga solisilvae]